ncbi:hypothetical protein L6164_007874 [Bauhinia variegata]|uniref:Uncharacterized protein n=1 Tax=Bauhinia variegata TaxID=167791 RepID=A0ACB9PES0_BAUVA|nr:hypothetical protein L6164_007874 [Bauhinia variegata]
MLHRSFKPAKCKTSLKLAVSRIKLLKNKREAQVKQLKRELAQLLESGQEQTARIRVEHVIREEKTITAYDLIEIYCELIAARMPMIESQKNCPIDLKEAISSVIFASPRCADIPELMDVKKHIIAKYGKDFVSSAVELRPDCGVNRMLVEKLSAKAPDGPTKIKVLSAIAEEHNIKWENKSFVENDTKSQDFQTGPNHYEKASYVEPPQIHASPVRDEKEPPNLHKHKEMHDVSAELHEHNASFHAEKVDGNKSTTSGRSNPEIRPPGSGSPEIRHSYPENGSSFLEGRHNRNMEFEDAASAAQAAAESAERASMAARAAAELSNREKRIRQYSTGSHNYPSSNFTDEVSQEVAFHDDKHPSTDLVNKTSSSDSMHNQKINAREQDKLMGRSDQYYGSSHENAVKHAQSQSASLTSSSSFVEYNPYGNGSQMADIHPLSNSFDLEKSDFLHEVSMKKPKSRPKEDFVSEPRVDMNTEDNYHFRDARMNVQSIDASSSSQYTSQFDSHDDVLELNRPKTGDNAIANFYDTDEGNIQRNFKEASSYDHTAVQFDDSGSEDDDYKFVIDKKYDGQGSSLHFTSGSKSEIDPIANRNASSPGRDIEEKGAISSSHFSVFSATLTESTYSPGREDLLPVTFDDSDGRSSENEEDLVKSEVDGLNQRANHGASGPINDGNVDIDRKMSLLSSVGLDTMQEHFEKNIASVSENNFRYDDSLTSHSSSTGMSSSLGLDVKENVESSQSPDISNDTETLEESHLDSGKGLNYGLLKGGLRNKGYRRPPYIKNLSGKGSLPSVDVSIQNEQSSPIMRTSMSSDAHDQETYTRELSRGNRSLGLRSDNISSGSDTYDMAANTQETVVPQDPPIKKVVNEVNKKSSRASVPYFDSDSSDSEDIIPKQSSARRARPAGGFSQRTTAPSKASTSSSSTATRLPKPSATASTKLGWKSSSRVSYDCESQKIGSFRTKSSDNSARSKLEPAKLAAAKSIPESNSNSSSPVETMTSSARIQPSSSLPRTETPDRVDDSGEGNQSKQKGLHRRSAKADALEVGRCKEEN